MGSKKSDDVRPARGDVWVADLDPTRGHEQAGRRPVLVVSANRLNRGPAGLVITVPLTTRDRGHPLHVPIDPPEGGITRHSVIQSENVRAIAKDRLIRRLGTVSSDTIAEVEDLLRVLLSL